MSFAIAMPVLSFMQPLELLGFMGGSPFRNHAFLLREPRFAHFELRKTLRGAVSAVFQIGIRGAGSDAATRAYLVPNRTTSGDFRESDFGEWYDRCDETGVASPSRRKFQGGLECCTSPLCSASFG